MFVNKVLYIKRIDKIYKYRWYIKLINEVFIIVLHIKFYEASLYIKFIGNVL